MRIAIASGKGGTGKTTFAVSLSIFLARNGLSVNYFDCDVDAPNANVFFNYQLEQVSEVDGYEPVVDESRCTHLNCAECAKTCRHGAITVLRDQLMIWSELCIGCGTCQEVCPQKAIDMRRRIIGWIESGGENPKLFQGRLRVGEPTTTKLIRKLKEYISPQAINIIDSPPGTGCSMLESIRDVDHVILVAEPTKFSLLDLQRALEVTANFNLNASVVLNKAGLEGETDIIKRELSELLNHYKVKLIAELPYDREIAVRYTRGGPELMKLLLEAHSDRLSNISYQLGLL